MPKVWATSSPEEEWLMAAVVQLTMSDIVKRIGTTDFLDAAAEYLETHGYTVIPPEGERA